MPSAVGAQDKTYFAQQFDVDIEVDGGDLIVTETVVFQFEGEPFTFAFRELLSDQTGGIEDLGVFLDGRPMTEGENAGQFELEHGNPARITWHFEPSLGARTFQLTYRMVDVVRRDGDTDLILYQPLPDEFEYFIESSTVTIRYPTDAALIGQPEVRQGRADINYDAGFATFQNSHLEEDETLVFALAFPAGSLIEAAPAWQVVKEAQDAYAPMWGIAAGVLSLLGAGVVVGWWNQVRPKPTHKPLDTPIYAPPSDLPPAMAGALNGTWASWSNALATLLDLADRGVLQISEQPKKSPWSSTDFTIDHLKTPKDLRPHEAGLLDAVFVTRKGRVDSVKMSELSHLPASTKRWAKFTEPLKEEMEQAGLWSTDGRKHRNRMMFLGLFGLVVLFACLIGFVFTFNTQFGEWPLLLMLPIMLTGILATTLGATLKPLSPEGVTLADEWQRFYKHMHSISRGKAMVDRVDNFGRFLPYAASYGLLAAWVKHFEKEGKVDVPHWFHVLPGGSVSHMATFATMANSSAAAGGSAGGAAGGAAGGGASGAG